VITGLEDQQAFFTVNLGMTRVVDSTDPSVKARVTEERFEHLLPVPEPLVTRMTEGLEILKEKRLLKHKGPVWAQMSGDLLNWLRKKEGEVPRIKFEVKEPPNFVPIYSGRMNVESETFRLQKALQGKPFLQAARDYATVSSYSVSVEDTK
jgi:hypothetical protein